MTIEARDMEGLEAPAGCGRSHAAGRDKPACCSVQTLEWGRKLGSGSDTCTGEEFDFGGRFGVGAGEWSLYVTAEGGEVQVMSLLDRHADHLANLSSTNRIPTDRPSWGKPLDRLPDTTIAQVKRWGPRSTGLGEPFNVQPNGDSVLWFHLLTLDRHDPDYKNLRRFAACAHGHERRTEPHHRQV